MGSSSGGQRGFTIFYVHIRGFFFFFFLRIKMTVLFRKLEKEKIKPSISDEERTLKMWLALNSMVFRGARDPGRGSLFLGETLTFIRGR